MKPLPPRTTFYLGETSRSVLVSGGKPSNRLEWVCRAYQEGALAALPRLRIDEWVWLCEVLATLDIRSTDHLALLQEKVRATPGVSAGIDHLGISARLASLSLLGRCGVWDVVQRVRQERAQGIAVDATDLAKWLPRSAILIA